MSSTAAPGQVRDVVERGLAAALRRVRLEVPLRAQHDVEFLHHVRRQTDRPRLAHDRALDRLPDPPGRVGGETEAALGVELFQRVDEAEIALLDQVGQREAAVDVVLGDADDEPQVALDHRLPRGEVAGARRARQRELFLGRQQRVATDVVEVDLREVGDEVGGQPLDRRLERQLPRPAVGLGNGGRDVVGVEVLVVGRVVGVRHRNSRQRRLDVGTRSPARRHGPGRVPTPAAGTAADPSACPAGGFRSAA